MKDARPRPEYFETVFTAELPSGGVPARFGLVTGENPNGKEASGEYNARADEELRRHLTVRGFSFFRVVGGSPDGRHAERGFGIAAETPAEIRRLSRMFRQDAFYWVQDGDISVSNTEGTLLWPVGRWVERLKA